jgi:hypothetical protein
MTPEPTSPPSQESAAAPPVAPAGPSMFHVFAIAAAVAGGGLFTLLLMAGQPAARKEALAAPTLRSAPGPAAKATPAIPGAAMPAWSTRNQSRWVSNRRKSAAFELEANQPVSVWMKQVRPTLVVRCMDRRTDVFIYTDSAARIEEQDENHTVRVAFDGDEGAHERWPDSVEHDALFAPDGKAMAGRIQASRQMRFTFSPHNAAPVTATFEVSGLRELLAPIAKRCGR